jgi:hypothetical protein
LFLTPLFKLFGINSAPNTASVSVSAVAVTQSRPAVPIALWGVVCPTDYLTNPAAVKSNVQIQMQHPDQKDGIENACWTTFFDCSSGAADIKAGFQVAEECTGASINGDLRIGSLICQNRGQVNSVMGEAKDFFFDPNHSNRWWVVPVIGGGGNCAPQNPTAITTWGKIKVTEIVKTGNPKYIKADVMCGDSLINDATASLCFSNRLVRDKASGM